METKIDNTTKPQHDAKLPVMRGASEIEARINDIEQNKANLQIDYAHSNSTKERLILVQMITECDLRIKDLKWCMGL
jgi:hypothetical protein